MAAQVPVPIEKQIFLTALQLSDSAERSRYLDSACGRDAQLRVRIEQLLALHCAHDLFMSDPAAKRSSPASESAEPTGFDAGPYRLLSKIGEGGCGVVYLAEQERPVRRQLALKIVKAGLASESVISRFEAERQTLALMDHPNIAKIFDAGSTAAGRPYFAMELVQGEKITDYCLKNRCSTEQTLALFLQVCHAVQHAHQKGIIHRDLKPSNVLVTERDEVPAAVVIDFGIAKAIQGKLADETFHTCLLQFIGTPAYISPEQARMSADVDTRSDIYSLGVLLYELLTGKPPFDNHELLTAGLDEMRRILTEQEPPRPTRALHLSNARAGKGPLSADLDWIVMKCLEKDRSRRYESASALAADLHKHMNHEPVLACPPSATYRFRKFLRRRRIPVAAAAFTATSLVLGMSVSVWQAVRATRAERQAQQQTVRAAAAETEARREAATAKAVKDFLTEQLFNANPYVTSSGNLSNRRAVLEHVAGAIEGKFRDQPEVEEEIRFALAVGFVGLSDAVNATIQQQKLLELRRARLPPGHSDILEIIGYLVMQYGFVGRHAQAEALLQEANGLPERLQMFPRAQPWSLLLVVCC